MTLRESFIALALEFDRRAREAAEGAAARAWAAAAVRVRDLLGESRPVGRIATVWEAMEGLELEIRRMQTVVREMPP